MVDRTKREVVDSSNQDGEGVVYTEDDTQWYNGYDGVVPNGLIERSCHEPGVFVWGN